MPKHIFSDSTEALNFPPRGLRGLRWLRAAILIELQLVALRVFEQRLKVLRGANMGMLATPLGFIHIPISRITFEAMVQNTSPQIAIDLSPPVPPCRKKSFELDVNERKRSSHAQEGSKLRTELMHIR